LGITAVKYLRTTWVKSRYPLSVTPRGKGNLIGRQIPTQVKKRLFQNSEPPVFGNIQEKSGCSMIQDETQGSYTK
jgi:hypothetical protein